MHLGVRGDAEFKIAVHIAHHDGARSGSGPGRQRVDGRHATHHATVGEWAQLHALALANATRYHRHCTHCDDRAARYDTGRGSGSRAAHTRGSLTVDRAPMIDANDRSIALCCAVLCCSCWNEPTGRATEQSERRAERAECALRCVSGRLAMHRTGHSAELWAATAALRGAAPNGISRAERSGAGAQAANRHRCFRHHRHAAATVRRKKPPPVSTERTEGR